MRVSEDLVILASELVKLTPKWDEGSDTAKKLGENPSGKLRVQLSPEKGKLIVWMKSKSQTLFTKFYCKNFGGLAEIHGLYVINNPWVTSTHILLMTLNFKKKT